MMAKILLDENQYENWQWFLVEDLAEDDKAIAQGAFLHQSRAAALGEAERVKKAFESVDLDEDVVETDADMDEKSNKLKGEFRL